ncbi:hypothetical protein Lal_00033761 [Lupinus albus]|nr:hypothetical protein Lal_00033761 [Lupinus albus]
MCQGGVGCEQPESCNYYDRNERSGQQFNPPYRENNYNFSWRSNNTLNHQYQYEEAPPPYVPPLPFHRRFAKANPSQPTGRKIKGKPKSNDWEKDKAPKTEVKTLPPPSVSALGSSLERERFIWEGEILGYTGGFSPERELSRLGEKCHFGAVATVRFSLERESLA